MKTIFDPIRNISVKATPEEEVRQRLIASMIGPLRYPRSLIAVEHEIGEGRRADLVVFSVGVELSPLLLIECKEGNLTSDHVEQLLGYNYHVKAPFIALASPQGVQTLIAPGQWIGTLPPFDELVKRRGGW